MMWSFVAMSAHRASSTGKDVTERVQFYSNNWTWCQLYVESVCMYSIYVCKSVYLFFCLSNVSACWPLCCLSHYLFACFDWNMSCCSWNAYSYMLQQISTASDWLVRVTESELKLLKHAPYVFLLALRSMSVGGSLQKFWPLSTNDLLQLLLPYSPWHRYLCCQLKVQ